ncbi:hypothetical protein FRB96_002767 [Tulasnella sp. 330]|nr:hypothetical protein FRB96_002767 [Tulasnella sp. 330]KAG8872090.1 hypothetical protein FRB97_008028 [Tulasnella sp. 331]
MPLLGLGVWLNATPIPACKAAFEAGYRHIDCAIAYGNEVDVGTAVRESGLDRKDLFITSKASPRQGKFPTYELAIKAIDDSLTRLEFDYLDLFLLHEASPTLVETWRALIKARDDGRVKSIGVSNFTPEHLEEIKKAGLEAPSVNQIHLHPWYQERNIVDYCNQHSIVIQAYSPLAHARHLDDVDVQAFAKKYKKDAGQILIRYSLQKGWVPLPKSANSVRVKSNCQVFDFELTKEEMEVLDQKPQDDPPPEA